MEISSTRLQLEDIENQYPMKSPRTSIGLHVPKTVLRSDSNNTYPTTFVQADSSSFKQVVQMLTGSQESTTQQPPSSRNFNIPPKKKHQGFKLYERRNNNLKNRLMINTLVPNLAHNNNNNKHNEILSPSFLDFPSLSLLSPITPLNDHDPFDKSSSSSLGSSSEEDKAIAQKGFYLHPSPMSTPREFEPQLLPLFPLSSPQSPS